MNKTAKYLCLITVTIAMTTHLAVFLGGVWVDTHSSKQEAAEIKVVPEVQNEPERQEHRRIEVIATAYCPCRICCGSYSDGYTADGHRIKAGERIIAVDPKVIKLGSVVRVPGYGEAVARDTGSDIRGARIDVLFAGDAYCEYYGKVVDAHKQALAWGRQKITVEVERDK